MADDTTKKDEPKKDEPEKDAKAEEPAEEEIPRERLIADAHDFFDCAPHVVAGALSGERKKNFTVSEVEKKVKSWLDRSAPRSTKAEEV